MATKENFSSENLPKSISTFPKVELHAHLFGSLSDGTLMNLLSSKRSLDESISDVNALKMGKKRTLNECFDVFRLIHSLAKSLDAVDIITRNVIEEFHSDGVVYLELRTTPKNVPESYSKEQYLVTVINAIRESENALGITVRLLVSFDRSRGVEDARDTLRITKELLKEDIYRSYISGIDVSGNPNCSSLIDFVPLLRESRSLGLKLAVHLLEVNTDLAHAEAEVILKEKLVDRIGHGIFLHGSTLESVVLAEKIPIEFCLTSNLRSGSIGNLDEHPVKFWHVKSHPFSICTDDKGVFSTSLTTEISLFMKVVCATVEDVSKISLSAVDASFVETKYKEDIHNRIKSYLLPRCS